jgi:hypothetical protein
LQKGHWQLQICDGQWFMENLQFSVLDFFESLEVGCAAAGAEGGQAAEDDAE